MEKVLYHGSDKIIRKPLYGIGKKDNDYGSGFYTTEDIEKAKEWAWINGTDSAICNKYTIDVANLNILNLNEYGTLAWIAEVIAHRGAKTEVTNELGDCIVDKYKVDTSKADIIVGYRADDSYINVVEAFLSNQLTVDEVDRQFRKGNLGQQVFIKSKKAFECIAFVGYEEVKPEQSRNYGDADSRARQEVTKFLNNRNLAIQKDGFVPMGITARDAINNDYTYSKDYGCYLLTDDSLTTTSSKTNIKRKSDYNDDL